MNREIRQLVEMGATVRQAEAALRQHKDVMQAAERIFDGQFDNLGEDDAAPSTSTRSERAGIATPEAEEDEEMADGGDDDEGDDEDDDFDIDYDSDYDTKPQQPAGRPSDVDPYSGIFFSKARREEVIEVEEEPEIIHLNNEKIPLMTQGQWMKGCPEGGEQSFLFTLYSQFTDSKCQCPNGCDTIIPLQKRDWFAIYPQFSTYITELRKKVQHKCQSCQSVFCLACSEIVTGQALENSADTIPNSLFHCSNLQGIILGVGLAMLEQQFTEQHDRDHTLEQDASKNRSPKKRKVETSTSIDEDDDEVYYLSSQGKKSKGGTGYAGNIREDMSGQVEAQAIQRAKDQKIGELMTALRVYLPSLHREGGGKTSDFLVHPATLAHLRRRFNYVCSSLLRNDSLADMSERSVLYFELMEWLETIANHEALASMMAMPIMVIVSARSTISKSSSKNNSLVRERAIIYEGSSGPRELLEAISIQADAALKGLEGLKAPETPLEEMTEEQKRMTASDKGKKKELYPSVHEDNRKLIEFCRRILSTVKGIDRSLLETKGEPFVKRLHAALPSISSGNVDAAEVGPGNDEESARSAYVEWATKVRFQYCDLSIPKDPNPEESEEDPVPHYKFYYNNEARVLANSDLPKRSLAIAKELAVLTTNLPVAYDSSIFLRADESRVDIIKALITGPEGTPYQNGCYLFDIFLGPSYNQAPPSVKYMTTNGGKFRFNPNLYADGKVCLSLLGTWSGPGWVAGRSTLLQVLISIQSMILCDEPYLNEPGWASSGGTPQSLAYSKNVRRMVVKTAMLGNLKQPPEPFGNIIRTHFRLKANSLVTQLDKWLAEDDGKATTPDGGGYGGGGGGAEIGSSVSPFRRDVDELKQILRKLQNGEWRADEDDT